MPDFRPRAWLRNGHLQTLLGFYLPSPGTPVGTRRYRVRLDDGDTLVLHDDRPDNWREGQRVAMLIHGLAGCHASGYMRRIALKLLARGVRVFRLDQRGCGAGEGLARKTTHCGSGSDAAAAVRFISSHCAQSPILVAGFSLGGTIALNMAADQGETICGGPERVLAICPPLDLPANARHFDTMAGRPFDRYFVRLLWRAARRRLSQLELPGTVDWKRRPRGLREFDDLITAPLAGFASAADYYERTSPAPRLESIRIPTVILAAADDPVVPATPLEATPLGEAVRLVMTRHGGHLGFISRRAEAPDRRWLDQFVVNWVLDEPAMKSPEFA